MVYLQHEEGRAKVGCGVGLVVALVAILALVACVTCALLLVLGPQIGNVFSSIESGLGAAG